MYLLNVQGKWALILCSYIRDSMLIEIIFVILECGVLGTQFVVIHSFFQILRSKLSQMREGLKSLSEYEKVG